MVRSSDKVHMTMEEEKDAHVPNSCDLDLLSSHPWKLINDASEITCFIWSRSSRMSERFMNIPYVYGSHGEGTATGQIEVNQRNEMTYLEDADRMFVVNLEGSPNIEMDTSGSHAGFLQFKNQSLILQDWGDVNLSLFSHSIKERYEEVLTKPFGSLWNKQPLAKSSLDHRNAFTSQLTGPANKVIGNFKGPTPSHVSIDSLMALPGPTPWPVEAEEWRTRTRRSDWPSPIQVEEVISQGYLLVPVAHPTSKHPESEWRFSFSEAEKTLIKSLDRWQKNCYRIVKLLCKKAFSGWKLLSTYHIKTMFLWMLEEYPLHCWGKENIGQMSCLLLDKLILAFAKRNLPSYFITSNNLIDHLPRDHISSGLQILREVRRNFLPHLVSLAIYLNADLTTKGKKLLKLLETKLNREEINAALIDWCKIIARVQGGLPYDALLYCDTLSYRPLIEIVLKKLEVDIQTPGTRFIDEIGCPLQQDIEVECEAYQIFLQLDLGSMYCALGSHFRVLYHNATSEEQAVSSFEQTRELFEKAIHAMQDEHSPWDYIIGEYAAFLLESGMHDEASNMLERQYREKGCYRHFVEGCGYLQIESKYFILWIKFNLALIRGEPVGSIVQEYEDRLIKDPDLSWNKIYNSYYEQYFNSCSGFARSMTDHQEVDDQSVPYIDYAKLAERVDKIHQIFRLRQELVLLKCMKEKMRRHQDHHLTTSGLGPGKICGYIYSDIY